MKLYRLLSLSLVGAIFLGVSSCESEFVDISLFHTNDLHSHLRSAKIDPFGLGGLARLSTLLQQVRKDSPNSLTLDAGDWSEGSWYFSVDVGANMLRFLDRMGYDAAALGNHDFLIGPDLLTKTILDEKVSFPVLAANLDMREYPKADQLRQAVLPSMIKEVGGLRVGFIGLSVFSATYESYFAPVRVTNPEDAATQLAIKMRPDVDLLVLISHNDFNDNAHYARAVPGVDVVLSGHTHVKTPKAVIVQNMGHDVAVVEAGAWGQFLGELKLSVDKNNRVVKIRDYVLHPVTPDIPEDPVIAEMVAEQDRLLNTQFNDDVHRVVAESEFDLVQQDWRESALGNLAVKAYRSSTGADLSLEEISLTGVSIAKGPTTLMDLHDVVPHIYNPATGKEWTLQLWNARGSDLLLAFNVFYTANGLMPLGSPLGWLSADNVQVVWNPIFSKFQPQVQLSPLFSVVDSIKIGGQEIQPSRRYKVALSDGLLLGIKLVNQKFQLGVDLSDVTDTGLEAWRSVVDYAASKRKLSLSDLRVGGSVFTSSADLAIFGYGMGWDGKTLSVEVENQGLTTSTAGSVICSSGIPNNFVVYDTTEQKWTEVGRATLPSVSIGGSVTLQIPWAGSAIQGFWPIKCEVSSSGESYLANNSATHVFRVLR